MIYKLLSTDFKPLGAYQVVYDVPFVLMTEIHVTSPWQLVIQSSQFHQVSWVLYTEIQYNDVL